jgi:hypothetical protein
VIEPGFSFERAMICATVPGPSCLATSVRLVREISPIIARSLSTSNGSVLLSATFITSCELVPSPIV